MAWEIIGYPTMAAAPIQDAAVLNAGTADQAPMQGVWINNTDTVSAQVTITLASGATLVGTAAVGTTIFPCQATNYTTAGSGVAAWNVKTA